MDIRFKTNGMSKREVENLGRKGEEMKRGRTIGSRFGNKVLGLTLFVLMVFVWGQGVKADGIAVNISGGNITVGGNTTITINATPQNATGVNGFIVNVTGNLGNTTTLGFNVSGLNASDGNLTINTLEGATIYGIYSDDTSNLTKGLIITTIANTTIQNSTSAYAINVSAVTDNKKGPLNITNAGNITGAIATGDNTLTLVNTGTVNGTITTGNGKDKLSGNGTFIGDIDLKEGANEINIGNGETLTFNSGNVLATGGNITFSGTGTFAGTSNLTASVNITSDLATFNSSGNMNITLIDDAKNITIGSSATGTNIISNGGKNLTGTLTLNSNLTYNATAGAANVGNVTLGSGVVLTFGGDQNLNVTGNIAGTNGTVTASGSKNLTLQGTNNTFMTLNINNGTVNVSGKLADNCNVTVANTTGAVYIASTDDTIGSLTVGYNGAANVTGANLTINGTAASNIAGNLTLNSALITEGSNDFTASRIQAGSGNITINSTGTNQLTFLGDQTGDLKINAGTTTVNCSANVGNVTLSSDATFVMGQSGKTIASINTTGSAVATVDLYGVNNATITNLGLNATSGMLVVKNTGGNQTHILNITNAATTGTIYIADDCRIGTADKIQNNLTIAGGKTLNATGADLTITTGNVLTLYTSNAGASLLSTDNSVTISGTVVINASNTKAGTQTVIEAAKNITYANGNVTINDQSAALSFSYAFNGASGVAQELSVTGSADTAAIGSAVSAAGADEAMGDALAQVINNPTSETQPLADALGELTSESELAEAVSQLNPTATAGTAEAGVAAMTAFSGGVLARVAEVRAAALAEAAPARRARGPRAPSSTMRDGYGVSIWANPYGTWGDQDSRKGVMGYEWDTYGFLVGFDKQIDQLVVGFAFGYSDTDYDADRWAKSDIDTWNIALYGTYNFKSNWYIDASVGYSWSDLDLRREIPFMGCTATAETDADAWTTTFGGGYNWKVGKYLTITPHAGIAYTGFEQDSYTEKGAPGANLHISDVDVDSFTHTLGIKTKIDVTDYIAFTLRGAWVHEYCDNQASFKASFAGTPSWDVNGLDPADDSAVFGAGIIGNINKYVSVGVNYDVELKGDYDKHNLGVLVNVSF